MHSLSKKAFSIMAAAVTACSACSFAAFADETENVPDTPMILSLDSGVANVNLNWTPITGAAGYRVYRRDNVTKKYVKVANVRGKNQYNEKNLANGTNCTYKVKAFSKADGKTVWGKASTAMTVSTKALGATELTSAELNDDGTLLSWNKADCLGYIIYGQLNGGSWVKLKVIKDKNATSVQIGSDEFDYSESESVRFRIKTYAKGANGKNVYSKAFTGDVISLTSPEEPQEPETPTTPAVPSTPAVPTEPTTPDVPNSDKPANNAPVVNEPTDEPVVNEPVSNEFFISGELTEGIISLNAIKRGSQKLSYKQINTQGSNDVVKTVKISERDKQVLDEFAKEHFKANWTAPQKIAYTLNWINKNTTYANGNLYVKIMSMGNAEAIFKYKLGQCLQYNGAIVEMMNYLGYDAKLIQGFRGTSNSNKWQHFWGEINIGGVDCVLETGCYQQDGDWYFLCVPYKFAPKYIKNGVVMK